MPDPVSPSVGQYIDKPFWDAEVYQRWVDLYGAWASYTPVWSNDASAPVLGNGTLVGKYKQIGKTVHFYIRFNYGSTSSIPGGSGASPWYFSLPVTPAISTVAAARGGATSGVYPLAAILLTTGRAWFTRHDGTAVNATVPTSWATGHLLVASGTYEAA